MYSAITAMMYCTVINLFILFTGIFVRKIIRDPYVFVYFILAGQLSILFLDWIGVLK